LSSKTLVGNTVADNANIEALWQQRELFLCHFFGAQSGALPIHKHIKMSRLWEVLANRRLPAGVELYDRESGGRNDSRRWKEI
jgi:hypothetical protein